MTLHAGVASVKPNSFFALLVCGPSKILDDLEKKYEDLYSKKRLLRHGEGLNDERNDKRKDLV